MVLQRLRAILVLLALCLTSCGGSTIVPSTTAPSAPEATAAEAASETLATGMAPSSAFAETFGDAESVVYFVRYENTDFGNSPLDLYALSLPSREVQQVTVGAKVRYVTVSPDGQSLVYLDAKADRTAPIEMMRSDLDGTNAWVLGETSSTGLLHWSPDGRSVIYGSILDDGEVILSMDIETGETRVLVAPALRAAHPIGVVDNTLIYIDLDIQDQRFARFDFETEETIDSVAFDRPFFQQIRPDGSAMLVGNSDGALFEIDLTEPGMAVTELGSTGESTRDLFISPDGELLGFVGRSDLFLAAGDEPTSLVEVRRSQRTDDLPLWTPDSTSMVYAGSKDFWDRTIYLASKDERFEETLVFTGEDLEIQGLPLLTVGP